MNDTDTLESPLTPPALPALAPSLETSTTAKPDSQDANGTDASSNAAGKSRKRAKQANKRVPSPKADSVNDGVDADGLVILTDCAALDRVPVYYYTDRGRWYAPNGVGSFGCFPEGNIKAMLAEYRFNRTIKDANGNTAAERASLWLMQNHAVAYAGALAGFNSGIHTIEGTQILVTESPRLPKPEPGEWPTIRTLIETQFDGPDYDQVTVLYVWLAQSFLALWQRATQRNYAFRHCPALALFGPRHCGKTALIDLVISPLFGGKKADPLNYMKEGKFNKDLIGASLLVLDDKGASANLNERRQRGECLKDLIWKPEQRMEGKNADALMLRPFWRMVFAGNDDDAGLQICPALSPSLQDKLIILLAQQAEGLPTTHEENDAWAARIRAELPAFAAFLLGFKPPAGLELDKRSRVANFWHPTVVSALRDMQPEMKLLELIDAFALVPVSATHWEGTATEFERAMRASDRDGITERLFISQQSAGRMLSELARVVPDRVQRTNRGNASFYRIKA